MDRVSLVSQQAKGHPVGLGTSTARSAHHARRVSVCAHTTGDLKIEPSCLTQPTLPLNPVLKVCPLFLMIILSHSDNVLLGFQDVLNAFGEARETYDAVLGLAEDSQRTLVKAHDRLARSFLRLRDIAVNPGLFFQALLESNPKLVITYDLLSYYATLFDWDSSLNFRSVIDRHTSVSDWLLSHQVALTIADPESPPEVETAGSGLSHEEKAALFGNSSDERDGEQDGEHDADVDMVPASS